MKALPNLWRWLPQPTLWSTFCNSSFLALATFKPLLTDPAMNGNQPWLLKQHQIIWERGEVGVLLLFPNPYVIICIFGKFKRSKMKIGPLSIKEGCCNNGVLFLCLFFASTLSFQACCFPVSETDRHWLWYLGGKISEWERWTLSGNQFLSGQPLSAACRSICISDISAFVFLRSFHLYFFKLFLSICSTQLLLWHSIPFLLICSNIQPPQLLQEM